MRLLGAVLAGGMSSRFGSDKALAVLDRTTLLDRVHVALAGQCDAVCVVGRGVVADWPRAGLGPLGGLAGALRHARTRGFDEVLTSAVDIPDLPPDLAEQLGPGPAFVADQPVVGRWRTADLPLLETILRSDGGRSMQRFARICSARSVALHAPLANINTPRDLANFAR
ncbi:molybdenum cofactor guanylyltransferase [Qipengyuania spongiae]|uniref:NTP transferase domain-containing protein n=1 Tax=Qipengyuania spongiae TaxID=2909673 RepID=A0ABY5SZK5_9SPHN|nr:NTP transferase domain-containing protein [Qipengyuania spongiae]UVI39620.1 NTP transferase domain-containing protein [Qipengyuania spongiae]